MTLTDVLLIFIQPFANYIEAGGSPIIAILACLGTFAILSSVIKDSSRTLGVLFVVCIAAPFLFIEYLIKKYKNKNEQI